MFCGLSAHSFVILFPSCSSISPNFDWISYTHKDMFKLWKERHNLSAGRPWDKVDLDWLDVIGVVSMTISPCPGSFRPGFIRRWGVRIIEPGRDQVVHHCYQTSQSQSVPRLSFLPARYQACICPKVTTSDRRVHQFRYVNMPYIWLVLFGHKQS